MDDSNEKKKYEKYCKDKPKNTGYNEQMDTKIENDRRPTPRK